VLLRSVPFHLDGCLLLCGAPFQWMEMLSKHLPLRKGRKERMEEEGQDRGSPGIAIVALGLSDGSILLFSPSHSKVVRTLSHGSSASAIIALTSKPVPFMEFKCGQLHPPLGCPERCHFEDLEK
jgi:hypothetical protein